MDKGQGLVNLNADPMAAFFEAPVANQNPMAPAFQEPAQVNAQGFAD